MANFQETSASYTIPVTSYETALCILPPAGKCRHVDSLRELYDKAYGRWPAHINLIYPFVAPEQLPQAQQQIQAQIQRTAMHSFDNGTTALQSSKSLVSPPTGPWNCYAHWPCKLLAINLQNTTFILPLAKPKTTQWRRLGS